MNDEREERLVPEIIPFQAPEVPISEALTMSIRELKARNQRLEEIEQGRNESGSMMKGEGVFLKGVQAGCLAEAESPVRIR